MCDAVGTGPHPSDTVRIRASTLRLGEKYCSSCNTLHDTMSGRWTGLLAALALCILAQGTLAQSRSLMQQQSQQQQATQQCLNLGGALQSACGSELQQATAATGTSSVQQIAQSGKTGQALSAVKPSGGCCSAACNFINAKCPCNAEVVSVAQQSLGVSGGDVAQALSKAGSNCGCPSKC